MPANSPFETFSKKAFKKGFLKENYSKSLSFYSLFLSSFFLMIAMIPVQGFGQSTTTVFDTAGTFTWTAPSNITSITVQAWGGGGAGGGNTLINDGGGGGGGGAYTNSILTVVPGTTYTLQVGAGGIGTTGDGQDGEDTWFIDSLTLLARAGKGGLSPAGTPQVGGLGGAGGVASPGAGNYSGGDGAKGGTSVAPFSPAGGGGGGSSAGSSSNGVNGNSPAIPIVESLGGDGGIAPPDGGYGGDGGGYDNPNGLLNGVAAHSPGGGGGGGGNPPPAQPVLTGTGGDGAPGRIIIITGQAIFSETGTWKAPACITSIVVEAWGAGAAGGGNDSVNNGGGGGGGGAYSKSVISVSPGQTYAVTVGTGGVGVLGAAGLDGGDSWFIDASTILAKGGTGGKPPIGAGGLAGLGGLASAGIGTTKYNGGDGGLGTDSDIGLGGGGGSSAGYLADGAVGGDATLLATVFVPAPGGVAPNGGGDGGDGQNNLLSGDGKSGFSPGGGGGGSSDIELGPDVKGGQGANGRIILTYPDANLVIGDNPVAADSLCPGGIDVPIHSFTLTGANSCNYETDFRFTTTGTYVSAEVLTFRLYYTTTNIFATTNLVALTSSSTGTGVHSFPSFVRPASSTPLYYWITMDVANTVTEGNTLIVSQTVPADFTASPVPTGSGAASGTQTFKGAPSLSSTLTPPGICTGATFTYSPTSVALDSSFSWTRATVAGITEPGTTGADGIIEALTNTTTSPINVTYVYATTSTSNKCSNPGEDVVVTVNPLPQGSVAGNTICGADPLDLGQLTWVSTAGTGPFSIIYEAGTVTASGVISGTSFTVNPNPVLTTTYTITSVTDANACVRTTGFTRDTASINVTAAPIVVNLQPRDTIICDGNSASFTISGTGIYNYSWEVSTNGGVAWTNVAVATGSQPVYTDSTTATLILSSTDTAHDGYLYRALLAPACGAVIDTSLIVTLTVNPTPSLSSSLAPTTICSGTTYSYTPTTTSGTATYLWTRATVSGITEPGTTGTSPIGEALTNTTSLPLDVLYNVLVTDGICDNSPGVDLMLSISPSPKLNSTLTPAAICSGEQFSYAPKSTEPDSSFAWSRLPAIGIIEPVSSGNDSINEVLSNSTSSAIDVSYVYVTTTPDCSVGGAGDTVVVTVNAGGIISLATPVGSDTQSLCLNSPIDTIRYTIGGSGINASATGLPNGVTGQYVAGVYTITGSPISDGVYNFTVNTFGECNQVSASGLLVVGLSRTSADSTDDQGVCLNTPIQDITYIVGGAGETAAVTGLPSGLTQIFDTVTKVLTISGTPTEGGGFTYTVSTAGPCAINTKTGKVTVGISLISAVGTDSQKVCLGSRVANITYRLVGGDSVPVVVGLPDGLTGSITSPGVFTIIGTPTVAGLFSYTITTTGTCADQSSIVGSVIVSIGRISAVGTDSQQICRNTPILPIDYYLVGGGFPVITGLPEGVTADTISAGIFRISGTPIEAGTFTYTISSQGTCGTPAEITSRMIVGLGLISAVGSDSQFVCLNAPIAAIDYQIVGGDIPAPSVAGLPAGFTAAFSAPGIFTITGTPTVAGLITYTISANGTCDSLSQLTGKIVVGIGLLSATGTDTSQVICKDTDPITPIVYAVVGGGTPTVDGLPNGLTYSSTVGNPAVLTISGTPSKAGTYKYYVTSTGGSCPTASTVEGLIVVNETTLDTTTTSGNKVQWICANTAIEDVVFNIGGTATGAVVSTLPLGLTGALNNDNTLFTISGTPNAQVVPGTYTFTVTTTGGICTQSSAYFTLTIYDPIAKFSADSTEGKNPLLVNFTNESVNADTYNWTFGDDQLSNVEDPSNGFNKPGIYEVVLIASKGLRCPDTASLVITVNQAYITSIPSVFTPNGDNSNDTYKVIAEDVERLSVEIFDRWGKQVAGWNSNFEGWDGSNMKNGKECTDGTYFVIINVLTNDGQQIQKTGTLYLVR